MPKLNKAAALMTIYTNDATGMILHGDELPDGGSWPGRQGGGGWVGKNEVTQAQFEKVLD